MEMECQHWPLKKRSKNGHHFVNIDHTEKFQITKPPKVWVSSFVSVEGNRISASAIMKNIEKQECIPVGCIPSATVAVSRGGLCSGGVYAPGGVCSWGGLCSGGGVCSRGCLLLGMSALRGVLPRGRGCLLLGVSAPGGCLLLVGVCSQGGVCSWGVSALGWGVCSWGCVCSGVVFQHALRQTPPHPYGQTDACKNITFATSLWMVMTAIL